MLLETATDLTVEFITKKLEILKETGVLGDALEKTIDFYDKPTIAFTSLEVSVDANTEPVAKIAAQKEIPLSDGSADTCNVFEDVQTVTTVLGVDCEAGAIEGFKDLAEKLVSEEAAANIRPGHPLYELVQAQQAGDMAEVNRQAGILALSFDLWQPDQAAESARLLEGTQFVMDDSGVMTVVDPQGRVLAQSDCSGVVSKYTGPMIDSGDCVVCEPEMAVEEPAKPEVVVEEKPDGPKIQTVEMCVAPGVCENFESVMVFDSVEQAREYFSNPDNVRNFPDSYQDSLQSRYRFFVVADGEGEYVQCLPFDIRGDEVYLKTDKMFPLEFRDKGRLVGHMSEGVAEKYFNGYVGTEGPRSTGGLEFGMEQGEAAFPSAPQEFAYDTEQGRYVLEPFNNSVERTYAMWVTEAGLSGSEWGAIADMPLPEEFADARASVEERATALREAAAERGVTMTQENAEELTRVINEGALGEDGGLKWDERRLIKGTELAVPAQQGGQMARLDSALLTASQNVTAVLRQAQGF